MRGITSVVVTGCLFLSACGGSSSSPDSNTDPTGSTNPNPVCTSATPAIANPAIYFGSLNGVPPANILLADMEAPEAGSRIVNAPLSPAQSISSYQLAPGNKCVIYISDEAAAGRFELYSVDLASPGNSARLNPALSGSRDIKDFVISPDGTEVLYRADQDNDGQNELYLVNVTTPGMSVRINDDLVNDGNVLSSGYEFSPDGSQIVYVADQRKDGLFELFMVNKAVPRNSTMVNPPFEDFVNLATGSKYSPDGNWIGYMADQEIDSVRELYVVDVANPGTSIKLNPDYSGSMDICSFEFRPDSQSVAYCADQDTDGILELYKTALDLPGISIKVNAPLVSGGEVSSTFLFSADSQFVVYVADQEVLDQRELFLVNESGPGVATKLNDELIAEGDVDLFRISGKSDSVAYVADQDTNGVFELFRVEISSPGMSVKMNPARQGTDLIPVEYSADSNRLVYLADQNVAERHELFRVDIDTPGESTRINARINAGGSVESFVIPR